MAYTVIVLYVTFLSFTLSPLCDQFEEQSTKCANYTFNDVYNFPDQSSQITTILMNVTSIVSGSFCRDRVLEFLCNYLFPSCENSLLVPICNNSCSEYLTSGICVEDLQNVLTLLTTGGYLNATVDELIEDDCFLLYNVPVSNNCNDLTCEWDLVSVCILLCVSAQMYQVALIMFGKGNVLVLYVSLHIHCRCLQVPLNDFCRTQRNFTDYAIDVAFLHVDIVNAWNKLRDVFLNAPNVNNFCFNFVAWVTCFYSFPPCKDFKLLLPCENTCDFLSNDIEVCLNDVLDIIEQLNFTILQEYFFMDFDCYTTDDYYINFKQPYFLPTPCFSPLPYLSGKPFNS